MTVFSIVSDERSILGESPIWDDKLQRIYWVDIEGKSLHAWSYIDNKKLFWSFDYRLCAISLTTNNNMLLCAFDNFLAFFDLNNQNIEKLNSQVSLPANVRFNDAKTDGYGRFWFGTMSESNPKNTDGSIYMLDSELNIHEIIKGIHISNSITPSYDNKYLYYTDTLKKIIYKLELIKNEPFVYNSTIYVDNTNLEGLPDGSTIDSNNFLWNAEWNGAQIVQYNQQGEVINSIKVPMQKPTCVAFGGPDMNKLFITSAIDNTEDMDHISGKTICISTSEKGNLSNRFFI